MPRATIIIGVSGSTLVKCCMDAVVPEGSSKHRVKKSTEVEWTSPHGALRIDFSGATSPFDSGELSLAAPQGQSTGQKTTTVPPGQVRHFRYRAEVTPPGQPPVNRDPELIVDDTPGPLKKGKKKTKTKGKTPKRKPPTK